MADTDPRTDAEILASLRQRHAVAKESRAPARHRSLDDAIKAVAAIGRKEDGTYPPCHYCGAVPRWNGDRIEIECDWSILHAEPDTTIRPAPATPPSESDPFADTGRIHSFGDDDDEY